MAKVAPPGPIVVTVKTSVAVVLSKQVLEDAVVKRALQAIRSQNPHFQPASQAIAFSVDEMTCEVGGVTGVMEQAP